MAVSVRAGRATHAAADAPDITIEIDLPGRLSGARAPAGRGDPHGSQAACAGIARVDAAGAFGQSLALTTTVPCTLSASPWTLAISFTAQPPAITRSV